MKHPVRTLRPGIGDGVLGHSNVKEVMKRGPRQGGLGEVTCRIQRMIRHKVKESIKTLKI